MVLVPPIALQDQLDMLGSSHLILYFFNMARTSYLMEL